MQTNPFLSKEDMVVKRKKFKNSVIAISGTCGKTTTCKFLYDILNKFVNVDKTSPNSNSFKGIPYCVNKYFNLNSKFWIIELGISKVKEMEELLEMVNPNIKILTNVGHAHTDNFTNGLEDYINEKLKFLKYKEGNVIIINNDNEIIKKYKFHPKVRVIRCGSNKEDDFQITNFQIVNDSMSICTINHKECKINFSVKSIFPYYCMNICLALACAIELKISFLEIINKKITFDLYENRGKINCINNLIIYDHSYNCSITSLEENLHYFQNIISDNKIIILGDMKEIKNPYFYHEKILSKILKITNHIYIYSLEYYKNCLHGKNVTIYNNLNLLQLMVKEYINSQKTKETIYIFIQGSNSTNLNKCLSFLINEFG